MTTVCVVAGSLAPQRGGQPNARLALAASLVEAGHTVHLVGPGRATEDREWNGLSLHEVPASERDARYSTTYPWLDPLLATGQALHARVARLAAEERVDVVDVPLDLGLALPFLQSPPASVVVWLAPAEERFEILPAEWASILDRLEQESLPKAAGAVVSSDSDRRPETVATGLPTFSPRPDEPVGPQLAGFYQQVLCSRPSHPPLLGPGRVFQVMEALSYGDAVSGIARQNAELLARLGHPFPILSLNADPLVAADTSPLEEYTYRQNDALIVHYWGFSRLESLLRSFPGRKAIHFHNVTPSTHFRPGTRQQRLTARGSRQIARMADQFDLAVSESRYNLEVYAGLLSSPKPTLWLPPAVETTVLRNAPFNKDLAGRLRRDGAFNFLFVGRMSPNKRQHEVMRVFDKFHQSIEPCSRLYLVGDMRNAPDYVQEISILRLRLASRDAIQMVGRVPDEDLRAYYRSADVFVSASVHEGFGVPLLEAMAFGVPVVARAAAAVPETMGRGGVLVTGWQESAVAELIGQLLDDGCFRGRVLDAQEQNLLRFSKAETEARLAVAADFLTRGIENPRMEWRGPGK